MIACVLCRWVNRLVRPIIVITCVLLDPLL